ncbi:MAG TPA: ABC transporter ATP-binding protein [Bacteroidota bacterium]|nr:ABC transporter ATP-binding protein [Bacteroidota bacterium]
MPTARETASPGADRPPFLPNVRFLWRFARERRTRLALALAALTLVSATSLLYPWLLKVMIDRLGRGAPPEAGIGGMATLLIAVLALSGAAGYYEQVELKKLGYLLRNAVRESLHASLLAREMAFHRASRLGELSARASADVGTLADIYTGLLAPAIQNALFIAGCLALMLLLNWLATILVLLLVLAPLPVIARLGRKIRAATAHGRAGAARAHALFEESLSAIREIKAFSRERLEASRYAGALRDALRGEMEGAVLQIGINQVVYMLASGALLAIFFLGTRRTFLPAWSLGDVVAFYFYSYTMMMAVLSAGKVVLSAHETAGALERVIELAAPAAAPPHADSVRETPRGTAIEMEGVRFSYDGERQILDGVSLAIPPGTWQVITGPSGSGKSTLAALLIGLYRPDAGSVRVGGLAPDAGLSRARDVGYAGQEPLLLHGTLRENIAFADAPATGAMIAGVVEACCLAPLVRSLPLGLDTPVGERGYTLSGGEKSRVAIARALLHDPPLLILDEVNTMLDAGTERALWRNLTALRRGLTTIVITHHAGGVPGGEGALELRGGVVLQQAAGALVGAGAR